MQREQRVTLLLPGFDSNHDAFTFTREDTRQPWQSQLAEIFGIASDGGKRLPFAALAGNDNANGLVRADPISLKADRDTAKLIPAEQLALSDIEADELLEALNGFVAEDGLQFFRRETTQWYLSGMSAAALESYPPSFLAGRNASAFMPEGDEAAHWRRLLTEVQMLLHMQPVNDRRIQQGQMPVNSLWFWGGTPLPQPVEENKSMLLVADDDEARALARYMGVVCEPLSALSSIHESLPDAAHILVLDSALVSAWLQADAEKMDNIVQRIKDQWLSPLAVQVAQGAVGEVHILTEDGLQGICDKQSIAASASVAQTHWWARLWKGLRR